MMTRWMARVVAAVVVLAAMPAWAQQDTGPSGSGMRPPPEDCTVNPDSPDCKKQQPADRLTRVDVVAGINQIKGKVMACGTAHKAAGTVKVKLTVGPNGKVVSAAAQDTFAGTAVGKCVEAAVKKASFRKVKGAPMTVMYPFVLTSTASPTPTPTPSPSPPTPSPSASTGPSQPPAAGDFDALLAEARTAGKAAQWGKSLRSAEGALRAQPSSQDALTIAALAACNLKDAAKAKKYISKLGDARQSMARQSCLRNGVQID